MENNAKLVRRWVYLVNVLRSLVYFELEDKVILLNNKTLRLNYDSYMNCAVRDYETNEVLAIFSEDGQPTYLTDWMRESIEREPYDFPMYEVNI